VIEGGDGVFRAERGAAAMRVDERQGDILVEVGELVSW
jgi:hypothetical protein